MRVLSHARECRAGFRLVSEEAVHAGAFAYSGVRLLTFLDRGVVGANGAWSEGRGRSLTRSAGRVGELWCTGGLSTVDQPRQILEGGGRVGGTDGPHRGNVRRMRRRGVRSVACRRRGRVGGRSMRRGRWSCHFPRDGRPRPGYGHLWCAGSAIQEAVQSVELCTSALGRIALR